MTDKSLLMLHFRTKFVQFLLILAKKYKGKISERQNYKLLYKTIKDRGRKINAFFVAFSKTLYLLKRALDFSNALVHNLLRK